MAEPKEVHADQEEGDAPEAGQHHYAHIGRAIHGAIQDGDHHALGRALHDAHKTFSSMHNEPDGDEGEGGKPNLAMLLLRKKRH